jgi:hypothetical protein
MRISLDNRYIAVGGRIAEHMLAPHLSDVSPLSWEEVYEGWKSDELKYYWKKVQFKRIPRYQGYSGKGFEEALVLSRKGDEQALLALRRVVAANPSSEEARRAREVLEELG